MLKLNYSDVGNSDLSKQADIDVEMASKAQIRDTAIGLGVMLIGAVYLGVRSFINGANGFFKAQDDALYDIGCLDFNPNDKDAPIYDVYKVKLK